MLPLLLFNVISSLVVDKATDLATEHVESMIDDLLPKEAKKELSIGVTYLKNLGSPDDEFFCYGFTHDLIVEITKIIVRWRII